MTPLRLVGLVLAATLAGTGLASATSYAAPGDASPPNAQGGYEPSYVTGNVNVRSGPSPRARVVNRLRRGQFVNLGACRGAWCFVDAQGGNGWVSGRFIGRGDNPYQRPGPAAPGIPPQEPGSGHRAPAGRY